MDVGRLRSYEGRDVGEPQVAPDEVNVAMIRHWCEAMGDRNPVYLDANAAACSVHGGLVAPPAMLQAWVMRPLGSQRVAGQARNAYEELLNKRPCFQCFLNFRVLCHLTNFLIDFRCLLGALTHIAKEQHK